MAAFYYCDRVKAEDLGKWLEQRAPEDRIVSMAAAKWDQVFAGGASLGPAAVTEWEIVVRLDPR